MPCWIRKPGLESFYPFDLMAAAYLRDPSHFHCARISAWVGDDALLPWFSGGDALFSLARRTAALSR